MTTFRDEFVSTEPSTGASEAIGYSHHSHQPPPPPIFHLKWIISHSGGTRSLLRDFSWEPTAVEGLKPSLSGCIPGWEAGRADPWGLAPAGLTSPGSPGLLDIPTLRTWPRSPVPGYPAGIFLPCSSPPCCQNGKACPYRLLRQAE